MFFYYYVFTHYLELDIIDIILLILDNQIIIDKY